MTSYAGRLLVATPALGDPNFDRTVVLVLRHDDEEGAVGLVLNRPSTTPVAEVLPAWADVVAEPALVFLGGPVGPGSGFGVAVAAHPPDEGWEAVAGPFGVVDLAAPPQPGLDGVRVFTQYAGWGSAQLDYEIGLGAWFVVDAEPGDLTTPEPERLWRTVLARQTGRLAWFAHHPADPTMN